jgi:3-deoxy-7-phosphoheptulonate synthase
MIVVLKPNIAKKQELAVLKEIRKLGYQPHVMRGVERTVIGAIGDERTHQSLETLVSWPQVESVTPIQKRFKLVSREAHPGNSTVKVRSHLIGGKKFHVMAGPCSVESEKQLMTTATAVAEAGATILRGGAFKPRTSPYEFQGLGEKGLKLLDKARRETGLAIVTELLSEQHAELVAEYADILQIGTRNAQNFQLLIAAAKTGKPVLLKRGLSMKVEEWLLAGEYILANENCNLMFCERGHSDFRDLHAQHTRSVDNSDHQKGVSPSHRDRPQPGSGARGPHRGHVPGRGGDGCGRIAHRSASESRRGLERRGAATFGRQIQAVDERAAAVYRCRRSRMSDGRGGDSGPAPPCHRA